MVLLADLEISRCALCGKMFQSESGKMWCRECSIEQGVFPRGDGEDALRREDQVIDTLVQQSDLDRLVVRAAVDRDMSGAVSVEPEPACVRCGKRPAIRDSEFCLDCHLDLYRALGDASRELFERMELVEHEPGGHMSVISVYRRKRGRIASSRINLVDTTARKTF